MSKHHHVSSETHSSSRDTTEERLWEARHSTLETAGEKPYSSFALSEMVRSDMAGNRDGRVEGGRQITEKKRQEETA